MKFRITMKELQRDGSIRVLQQRAEAPSEQDVIDWYGLNEPDIIEFKITKLD